VAQNEFKTLARLYAAAPGYVNATPEVYGHVYKLRKLMGKGSIKCVSRLGYSLVPEAREEAEKILKFQTRDR
jgi:hypothetical protein